MSLQSTPLLKTVFGNWNNWEGPFDAAKDKRQFIDEHCHLLESKERGCNFMKLHRSTYYHQPKNNVVNDSELIALIKVIVEECPGYG